jgi:hypothetical protein
MNEYNNSEYGDSEYSFGDLDRDDNIDNDIDIRDKDVLNLPLCVFLNRYSAERKARCHKLARDHHLNVIYNIRDLWGSSTNISQLILMMRIAPNVCAIHRTELLMSSMDVRLDCMVPESRFKCIDRVIHWQSYVFPAPPMCLNEEEYRCLSDYYLGNQYLLVVFQYI